MLAFFASVAAAVQPAPPATISIADPQNLVTYLQSNGFKAQLDLSGDFPRIRSGVSGWNYTISFHNCTNGKQCHDLLFYSGWETRADAKPPLDKINAFNRENRFVRAFVDEEKDPIIEMDVVFTDHQMSEAMFKEHLDIWDSMIVKFVSELDLD